MKRETKEGRIEKEKKRKKKENEKQGEI